MEYGMCNITVRVHITKYEMKNKNTNAMKPDIDTIYHKKATHRNSQIHKYSISN